MLPKNTSPPDLGTLVSWKSLKKKQTNSSFEHISKHISWFLRKWRCMKPTWFGWSLMACDVSFSAACFSPKCSLHKQHQCIWGRKVSSVPNDFPKINDCGSDILLPALFFQLVEEEFWRCSSFSPTIAYISFSPWQSYAIHVRRAGGTLKATPRNLGLSPCDCLHYPQKLKVT